MTVSRKQIVLVDSDSEIHDLVTAYFKPKGFSVIGFTDPQAALDASQSEGFQWDILLTDFHFAEMNEHEFMSQLKKNIPQLPILFITDSDKVEKKTETLEQGSFSFVVKPINFLKLHKNIENELQSTKSDDSNLQLHKINRKVHSAQGHIIGNSLVFKTALELARRVAKSKANIFITGESGSGKEIFAKFIHTESKCQKGKFIAINCSAIPENLLESELFGHAKGSFTGAYDKKIGLFEEAQDGTLFLDEIGDLSLSLQAKLLRVLQEKTIKRVGENQFRGINCRIISATHKNLASEVRDGSFREDLYFRLNVIPIVIPPLRERVEDLLPLAESFLKKFAAQNDSAARSFSKDAIDFLHQNPWRGNVRELENAIERAVVLCNEPEISALYFMPLNSGLDFKNANLDQEVDALDFHVHCDLRHLPTLEEVIYKYIEYAVKKNNGARDKTAKEIGIDRKTLYKRMKREAVLVH